MLVQIQLGSFSGDTMNHTKLVGTCVHCNNKCEGIGADFEDAMLLLVHFHTCVRGFKGKVETSIINDEEVLYYFRQLKGMD